jgi:hypothetical protein
MKKHARKLILNRETLLHLEGLRNVGGGYYAIYTNVTKCAGCGADDGTYGYCVNTYEACSNNYCETGGAACSNASCP